MDKGLFKSRKKDHHIFKADSKFSYEEIRLGDLLDNKKEEGEASLYIHIPYCSKTCSFCNMLRTASKVDPGYKDLIKKNISLISNTKYGKSLKINSIYFGGGTPTTMASQDLVEIISFARDSFNIDENAEISIETSLTDLDGENLKSLMEAGVNRISVGIQTFNDEGRKLLGRSGDGEFALARIDEYFKCGLKNINIDLIYNYSGQTIEDLKEDLKIIGELNLAGFSFYSLIMMKDSKLSQSLSEADKKASNDIDHDFSFYKEVIKNAQRYGYAFFELTKMVRPGKDSYKYIDNTHNGRDIIPLGSGAGGRLLGCGTMNPLKPELYEMILGNFYDISLRKYEDEYNKRMKMISNIQFGYIDLDPAIVESNRDLKDFLASLVAENLIIPNNGSYKLSDLGRFWGNNISHVIADLIL